MDHFKWQFLIQYIMLIIAIIVVLYIGLCFIEVWPKKQNVTKIVTNEKESKNKKSIICRFLRKKGR
jgi:hypothetical protein